MRLVEWRKGEGLSQQDLADELQITQPAISAIERWPVNAIPSARLMVRIFRRTFGAVTPNDFYNLPVLEQLALPMEDSKPVTPAPAPLFDRAAIASPELARAA